MIPIIDKILDCKTDEDLAHVIIEVIRTAHEYTHDEISQINLALQNMCEITSNDIIFDDFNIEEE